MADVYEYTDYRKFIVDRLAELKSANREYTYRYIAAKMGFKSPGFLTQIIQGLTRLPNRFVLKMGEVLELKRREARYFQLMSQYGQAKTHDEKKEHFEKMMSFKQSLVSALDPSLYDFYDKWYYSAIRAVLQYMDFKDDYKALSRCLEPAITHAEAKKAIKVLEQLNFIERKEDGCYTLSSLHVTSGVQAEAIVINNFVINTLEIAKNAFYKFPRERRSFSALTLGISQQGFERIKDKIDDFRREIVSIVREERNVDRVYQMNIQLFPLTKQDEEV